jgi:hypothetical protein
MKRFIWLRRCHRARALFSRLASPSLLLGAALVLAGVRADAAPPRVSILAPDSQALAGTSTGAFTLLRDSGTNAPLAVDLDIAGTAVNGVDYEAITNRVTIPEGYYAVDLLVRPLPVALSARNKSVVINVRTNEAYVVRAPGRATVTLVEDLYNVPVPYVALTSPTQGAFVQGPVVTLSADASEPVTGIAQVTFFINDQKIGVTTNTPYAVAWTNDVGPGRFTAFAKAVDGIGRAGLSAPVSFHVTNAPLGLAIVSPTNGAVIPAGNITVTATLSGGAASVASVAFYANDVLVGRALSQPYSVAWTNARPGRYDLVARAFDASGVIARSEPVAVRVTSIPPRVAITAPTNGASFGINKAIVITADAQQGSAPLRKVDFFIDHKLFATATNAPYTATWTGSARATHVISARATDILGVGVDSRPVTVKVTSQPPAVRMVSPTNGAVVTLPVVVKVEADVVPGDGKVTKVNFWAGRRIVATMTNAPYAFLWTNPPVGKVAIEAHAQDATGAVGVSSSVSLTVRR